MSKFTCPFCYNVHKTENCKMYCSYNYDCPNGVTRVSKFFVENKDDKKKCARCKLAVRKYLCPVINKMVPPDCTYSDSLTISLVGAKDTGKSNYIGVLINEIRRKMTRYFGTSINLNCDPETTANYNNNYYKPLYLENTQIGTTLRGEVRPMVFPVNFPSGKRVTITFYDTSGENFEDEAMFLANNGYLPHSDGIIMLLDPLQVPEIRKKLKGRVALPEQHAEAFDILDIVVQNIEQVTNNHNVKKRFGMPIALVFTKMDVLERYDDLLPADSCLRYDSEHAERGAFIREDFESTQNEMARLLGNLLDGGIYEFANKMSRFKNSALFGLTALGGMPDASGRLQGGVKPRRVLDPLLWLLAENNYIKTVK